MSTEPTRVTKKLHHRRYFRKLQQGRIRTTGTTCHTSQEGQSETRHRRGKFRCLFPSGLELDPLTSQPGMLLN